MRRRIDHHWLQDATLLVGLAWMPAARASIDEAQAPDILDLGAGAGLLQITLNLLLVLGAIVLLAWLFKRVQGISQPAAGALGVAASLPLGPKERLLLVNVGDTQLLIGASSAGINTLHVLDQPLEPTAEQPIATAFKDRLSEAVARSRS